MEYISAYLPASPASLAAARAGSQADPERALGASQEELGPCVCVCVGVCVCVCVMCVYLYVGVTE
jgi:hypothetical protein